MKNPDHGVLGSMRTVRLRGPAHLVEAAVTADLTQTFRVGPHWFARRYVYPGRECQWALQPPSGGFSSYFDLYCFVRTLLGIQCSLSIVSGSPLRNCVAFVAGARYPSQPQFSGLPLGFWTYNPEIDEGY